MDAENVKSEFVPVENGPISGPIEPITFGSHGPEVPKNGPEAHLPNNAVDEWPETRPTHTYAFHFVRYRMFEDPKIKAKLDIAQKDARNKDQARSQILDKLQAIRSKRHQISEKIKPLAEENSKFKSIMDGQKKEMEPLNQALNQLRTNNSNRERGPPICSSEEELNRLIKSYQYRIQHESIPLTEEKQILREIKQLEGTRPKVLEKAASRAKIEESLGGKDALQDQVNLIGDGFSGMKKERQVIAARIKQLIEERAVIDKDIEKLQDELKAATEKRDTARDVVKGLYKVLDDSNAGFNKNKSLLYKAKQLADNRDVAALKEVSDSELEKFMNMWNESKPFRDDYEKRLLESLDKRQMSRDGRMRNPDEKPLVIVPEPPVPSKPEPVVPLKPKQKVEPTEKSKVEKEAKNKPIETVELEDEVKITENEKLKKVENKIDEAKMREIKREEEIAKAKQALERKKKLAEKAAAKAAIKAQKEAEKKVKDREKKLKKKASVSGLVPEPGEQTTDAEAILEPEKVEEAIEESKAPKSKGRKESATRNRTRSKGPDSVSKAILKRKKSTNYWVWAAPAAVSVMMVFVIGYKYLI